MRDFLRNHLNLLIAVFLAILLWLFVTGDDITRATMVRKIIQEVPLSYENLDAGLTISKMPQTVDITVEGLPDAFDELEESELEAYLDLTGVKSGVHQVRVRGKAPQGLSLVSLAPQQVEVHIEKLKSRHFPVEVHFRGQPARGFVRQQYICRPAQVKLEAVSAQLNKVARVVVSVDLSDQKDYLEVELTPQLLDESDKEITGMVISPPKVTVAVQIEAKEK